MKGIEAMPIITIIVPVYNVEKYLDRCVKSILAQTFKDFELILVDDGSKDKSGEMCDIYSKTDSRIKVIHKKNGGLSSARNAGIEAAAGDYLGFVDSDDYIAADMYEVLYNNMIKEKADISICGRYDCYGGKKPKENRKCYNVTNAEGAINLILQIGVSAWDKLYKKSFFEKIKFPINKTAEDAFIMIDLLMKCDKVVYTSDQKYYYFHRENSITTQLSCSNRFDDIEAWKKNYDLVNKYYPHLHNVIKCRLCESYFFVLDKVLNSYDEDKYLDKEKKIIIFLKKNSGFIIFKSGLSLKRKLAMCFLLCSKSAYKKLVILNNKAHPIN